MSPTFDRPAPFRREFKRLSEDDKSKVRRAVRKFVADLKSMEEGTGKGMSPELRVKEVQRRPGIYELTWGENGRATFEYAPERIPGKRHVKWRHIGGHDIFDNP